jgi:hypothetical protein
MTTTVDVVWSPALVATEAARTRLRAWEAAGRPHFTDRDIGLRFRYQGSGRTLRLLRASLSSGAIAAPAVWHLVNRVATVAIGRGADGLCLAAPQSAVERQIIFMDLWGPLEIVSLYKHEAAHAFLLPAPWRDITAEEEALALGPDAWKYVARHGVLADYVARNRQAEIDACALAKAWGATGRAADPDYCADGAEYFTRLEAEG